MNRTFTWQVALLGTSLLLMLAAIVLMPPLTPVADPRLTSIVGFDEAPDAPAETVAETLVPSPTPAISTDPTPAAAAPATPPTPTPVGFAP